VGLQGIGVDVYEEHFWELRPVRFEYLYVGLLALDALEYVQGDNWLGVALSALMRIPRERAAWLGAEALRRIQGAPLTDQQRFLLCECVQAYLPLDPEQQREFERLIVTEPYRGVKAMNTTWYEKGLAKGREEGREEGREQGREQGQRAILRDLVEEKFGPQSVQVQDRLQQLSIDRLAGLTKAVLHARSLRELGLED
jgi:predicted transposase YdaD